jgi:hypothetical protein
LRIVDGVVGVVKTSIELWLALLEISGFLQNRMDLPWIWVQNEER